MHAREERERGRPAHGVPVTDRHGGDGGGRDGGGGTRQNERDTGRGAFTKREYNRLIRATTASPGTIDVAAARAVVCDYERPR